MNKPTILSAKKINKSYPQVGAEDIHVLKDFSVDIKAGEIVALVGPSGSGKSTLLHVLGLLDSFDDGALLMNGIETKDMSQRVRTKTRRDDVGFIYQFHHLLPEFSAVENIMLPQIVAGISKADAKARTLDLLEQLKLSHRANNRPAQLSGGEQQRVAIGRALANKPKLILADEPTGNLDPETSDTVFNILIDVVRDSGAGALIATHNMDLAKKMDRTVWF